MTHYPAQAMSHHTAALEAEAEAATYDLIAALCGDDDVRATSGHGGPKLEACGGATTVKQQIANIIAEDPELNRWVFTKCKYACT